ncbi:hypothetical protein JI664_12875 [Rhodobacter sp. NTK016B]|uniref:hypothetical protein n=1 Tax=Rhodobacter sp. NTK016B TaxID=2759676 RepID=UPI001A8C1E05|nr:hypothetical protein [Rhodobacter sp. NTK016B]MBN8292861.1 hypothetical protein [Rhodobacter sp. NTK016B]
MSFQTYTAVKAGRKAHRCDYCGGTIPKGEPSRIESGIWDGDFYSHRGHLDCIEMWNLAFHDHGDPWDGMAIDLLEAIGDGASSDDLQHELDLYRGHFPHVVCRLELREQRGHIRWRDHCRGLGIEPDPEDCPEVYG